jgi:hypothetical protein
MQTIKTRACVRQWIWKSLGRFANNRKSAVMSGRHGSRRRERAHGLRGMTVNQSVLLLIVMIGWSGAHVAADFVTQPRDMREPVVVSIALPASDLLLQRDSKPRTEYQQQIQEAVAEGIAEHPNRLVVLNPVAGWLRFEMLPPVEREILEERYGEAAADIYEQAMMNFLGMTIKDLRASSNVPAVSVQGLPVEPLRSSFHEAMATNDRYRSVIDQLDAFVQPMPVLSGDRGGDELEMVFQSLTESLRVNSGQPIAYMADDTWRIVANDPKTLANEIYFGPESMMNVAGLFDDAADALMMASESSHTADVEEHAERYENAANDLIRLGMQIVHYDDDLPYLGYREPIPSFREEVGDCGNDDNGPPPPVDACTDPDYNPWDNLHDFTGLPMTCDGWTDLSAMYEHPALYTNSRIIYVSSSQGSNSTGTWYSPGDPAIGSDPFNPVGSIQPYQTIAAGFNQLRDGYADILLLKRGDVWEESSFFMDLEGPSQLERIIISEYGTGSSRPTIRTEDGNGFWNHGGGKSSNLIVAHLHLNSDGRTDDGGGTAFRLRGTPGDHMLIEGCLIREFSDNIAIVPDGPMSYIVIRRNVIVDSYDTSSHSQGIFASTNTNDLLIEENVLDHNGWHPTIQSPTIHNHNIYLNASVNRPVVRRNIITRASSHGTQLGFGGDAIENVYSHNPIALIMSRDPDDPVIGRALRNVILEGTDMASTPRGFGIQIKRAEDVLADENIIANINNASSPAPFRLNEESNIVPSEMIRLQNNIVYNWGGAGIRIYGTSDSQEIQLSGNRIVNTLNGDAGVRHNSTTTLGIVTANNNLFDLAAPAGQHALVGGDSMTIADWSDFVLGNGGQSAAVNFPNPDRTLGTYAGSMMLPSNFEGFINEARKQSRANWNRDLTAYRIINYIRDGFGLEPIDEQ